MFESRAPHIADGDYPSFQCNIFVKDLGIVTDEASRNQVATTPDEALSLYQKASESGLGHEDDSAVVKILAQQSRSRSGINHAKTWMCGR